MRKSLLIFLVGVFISFSPSSLYSQSWSDSIVEELKSIGLSERQSRNLLTSPKVKFYDDIMEKFNPSVDTTGIPRNVYDQFLTPRSVQAGKDFLRDNNQLLTRAESTFGIPKEIFVSFLRVESNFGNNTGSYQAFGVFVSIIRYSSDKDRVEWAHRELTALVKLSRELGRDPLDINSSYAGAFGLPQFMPTSFLVFARDGNNDGEIDLFDLEDAVWSIGNYLVSHDWQRDPRGAVFDYNHSYNFVDCIFEYAELIKN